MTYTPEQLEQFKRTIPAPQILSTRLKLEKSGREWVCLCWLHDDTNPSMKVYQQDGCWLLHCFVCGGTMNVFQAVQMLDKIPFNAAVEKVLTESKTKAEDIFVPVLEKQYLTYPLDALKVPTNAIGSSQSALNWLSARQVSLETVQSLRIGYIEKLPFQSSNPWADKGWLVIPTITDGIVTCIKYRSLVAKKSEDGKISGILRAPKMQTSLYNLDSITFMDDSYLVEGEIDAWTMAQAGFACCALPSAEYALTPAEKDKLTQANRIFLAGDADSVGQTAMKKLWSEIRKRVYLIEWPQGCKDANDALVKECGGDNIKFQELVEKLKTAALEKPMPFVHDLKHTLKTSVRVPPFENPSRLRFPWANIDSWTPVVPGDIMTVFGTESKVGKSTWIMNILLHNVIKYGRIVVNYSAEIMPNEYARRATAQLVSKDRLKLVSNDFDLATDMLSESRFYNGYQPAASYKTVAELFRDAKKRLGADIFVVDHLHFLTRGSDDKSTAREADAMRMFKDFAFDYGVIVIVVGQPRKMNGNQRGREAISQDLKGSEALGSDSSQVFILHRDRVKDQKEGDPIFSPVTKVKLDYSRESETKVTSLWFEGNTCTFWPLEKYQGGL